MKYTVNKDGRPKDLSTLFSPIQIGSRMVKNRIVSTAHAIAFDDGVLNDRHVRYYERKAAGGAGLIMTFGSASVYKESSASYGSVSLWNPENEPFLKDLATRVHAHGSLIISQATHMGRRSNSTANGRPVQAPSAIPEGVHQEIPHVLRTDEIPPIVNAFAEAAERLERCGWDGIEITSFGGHLIEQFWSPVINNRTDQYGGDLNGRMRFSIEVIEAVAKAVSDDFIVAFRMTGDPLTDEIGLDRNDMHEIAMKLDSLGRIDLFNISGGTGATFYAEAATVPGDTFERGTYNHLARSMKERLSVPVLVAGRNLDPVQAEEALTREDCDLVGMTRAIIADPDMPNRAREGKISRIRPCIACNEGCIGRVTMGMSLTCSINPAIADDSLDDLKPIEDRRRVIIIGGGPAGMETARVAAERGHEVVLLERLNRLGGQIVPASAALERPHYGKHIKWLERELIRLDVDIRLDTEVTARDVLELNPDELVLATGSHSLTPSETSEIKAHCVTDVDLLDNKFEMVPGARVLVFDQEGKTRGASIANFVAKKGASQVELVTPLWSVCDNLDKFKKAEMYRLLGKQGVKLFPNQILKGHRDGCLLLSDAWSGSERVIEEVDLIVFVGYREVEDRLFEQITDTSPAFKVHLIGDAVSPRGMNDAIAEGVRLGNTL